MIEALQDEMNRARELLKMYEEIPQGQFGAVIIKQSILLTEKAIASGDVVKMIECLGLLKELQ